MKQYLSQLPLTKEAIIEAITPHGSTPHDLMVALMEKNYQIPTAEEVEPFVKLIEEVATFEADSRLHLKN